ncbi:hypothetical protein EPUS_00171 [Endocarpon pusillum Z07020]|uniref:Uncharacterized protein n=1 Tax=Endocarpon pusillum (strain Z07020 / HMAS-L-300199) TaxID=1263415 RepID=U1GSK7_ENDPU|nr:uncharacterized protein EPUS_00171 [Endocarpon pusillum Z07020]ERF75378.1 hypothetical protein EPUS_00171 [Endocarpon pusillum Z07020]
MAQGTVKTKTSKPSKPSRTSKNSITKKGARTIAPKKTFLMKQQKMTKRFSAGLTAKTEKMLGEKVGHLEMLGVEKKKRNNENDKAGKGQSKKKG